MPGLAVARERIVHAGRAIDVLSGPPASRPRAIVAAHPYAELGASAVQRLSSVTAARVVCVNVPDASTVDDIVAAVPITCRPLAGHPDAAGAVGEFLDTLLTAS